MNYDQMIYEAALEQGFSPTASKLIVAQARGESSDYTSNVFQKNFNLFGMKFVNQPLAKRGTLAPASERRCGGNCDSDYYAAYPSPKESVQDLVGRLYKITRNGIGFNELKNVQDSTEFAQKLKQRGYFGVSADHYKRLLDYKLLKINVYEVVKKNKGTISVGLVLLAAGIYLYLNVKKS